MVNEYTVEIENLEAVVAEYFDTDAVITSPYRLYRFNNRGKRFYTTEIDGKIELFPSVTTVIHDTAKVSIGLEKWKQSHSAEEQRRILDETSNYGTYFHARAGEVALGATASLDAEKIRQDMLTFYQHNDCDYTPELIRDNVRKFQFDIYGFVRWLKDYDVKPLAVEMPIIGDIDGLYYAGSIDLVAYIGKDRELSIIDFKTGRNAFYETHPPQLRAYRDAWNNMYVDLPIKKCYNYGCKDYRIPLGKTVTPYRFKLQNNEPEFEFFETYLKQFYSRGLHEVKNGTAFRSIDISAEKDIDDVTEKVEVREQLRSLFEEDK